jgi:hypothetical protein
MVSAGWIIVAVVVVAGAAVGVYLWYRSKKKDVVSLVDTSKPFFTGFYTTPLSGAFQIYDPKAKTYTLTDGNFKEASLIAWPMPSGADSKTITVSWAMKTIAPTLSTIPVGDSLGLSLFRKVDTTDLQKVDSSGAIELEINEYHAKCVISANGDSTKSFTTNTPVNWVGGEQYYIFTRDPTNKCSLYTQKTPASQGLDKSAALLATATIPAFTPNTPTEKYFLVFEGFSGSGAAITRVIRDIQVSLS